MPVVAVVARAIGRVLGEIRGEEADLGQPKEGVEQRAVPVLWSVDHVVVELQQVSSARLCERLRVAVLSDVLRVLDHTDTRVGERIEVAVVPSVDALSQTTISRVSADVRARTFSTHCPEELQGSCVRTTIAMLIALLWPRRARSRSRNPPSSPRRRSAGTLLLLHLVQHTAYARRVMPMRAIFFPPLPPAGGNRASLGRASAGTPCCSCSSGRAP